jgi:aconitate hydratase
MFCEIKNESFGELFKRMITKNGILDILLEAGARILESACGPCIGMGQSPATNAVSLRTFNRNFYGRSGTNSAQVYLVSPEVAALSAVNGYISNPLGIEADKQFSLDVEYPICDSLLYKPTFKSEIVMGPNIKALPKFAPIGHDFTVKTMISAPENITSEPVVPPADVDETAPFQPYFADSSITPAGAGRDSSRSGATLCFAGFLIRVSLSFRQELIEL